MTGAVRTVLGDVPADRLGPTDYHDHLFQVTPLLPGDELDDEDRSGREAADLHAAGIGAMVDATPTGLGRDPAATARISAATGLHVIATTGAHREAHYPDGHWLRGLSADRMAARFTRDVLEGIPARDDGTGTGPARAPDGAPVRAGLVKAGIGYWSISRFERDVLGAAAAVSTDTGVAVMVHIEHGSAAVEVLELLAAEGVPADRVVLAHVDRNPDPGLHADLAAAGCYLGYDGMARTREWPDSTLVDCLRRVVELGGRERLLLGGDVARRTRYVAYGGMPGLAYLPRRFLPRLRAEVGDDVVRTVLVDNPARLLERRAV